MRIDSSPESPLRDPATDPLMDPAGDVLDPLTDPADTTRDPMVPPIPLNAAAPVSPSDVPPPDAERSREEAPDPDPALDPLEPAGEVDEFYESAGVPPD